MKKTNKQSYRALELVLMLAVCSTLLMIPVSAATPANLYTLQAVIPDNQVDRNTTYFDIRMEPGQSQTLQMRILNSGDEEILAHVDLNTASTGRNGVIVYSQSGVRDESLFLPIDEIATVLTPDVRVPANDSALVDIAVAMPDTEFDGVLLGGLYVTAEYPDREEDNTGGVSLVNEFAYVMGLKISQTDAIVEPDFQLVSVEPALVNYHTALVINLQNNQPAIASGMRVTAQVFERGSDAPLREMELDPASMAPNSNGDFVVDWESREILAGNYRLRLVVEWNERFWEWDEEFDIAASQAGEVNNNAVELDKDTAAWWPWILLILLLALIAVAYWFGKQSRDKDK